MTKFPKIELSEILFFIKSSKIKHSLSVRVLLVGTHSSQINKDSIKFQVSSSSIRGIRYCSKGAVIFYLHIYL